MASFTRPFMRKLYIILIVLVSLVLCVRQLGEPDVWWQIRTGEFILEQGYVPDTDVFSYTYAGDPWINVKWGTEVIMALVSKWFGPETLMLLHWLILLAIMYLSYRSYHELQKITGNHAGKPTGGFYWAFLAFLVAIAYRINARPEMMSHLLTAVYVFLFLRHQNEGDRWIFMLIPLQMIWANLHEAYGVGQVLIVIFLASLWYRYWFFRQNSAFSRKQLISATIVGILALFSVAIHPMGSAMLIRAFNIFGQLGANKFTTELWSFKQAEFWNLAAYLTLILTALVFWRWFRKEKSSYRWQKLPLFYLVFILAFVYLASSANRNLPFLLITLLPLLALDLELWLNNGKINRIAFITASLLFYFYVASNNFYQRFYPVEKYGLRVDMQSTPVGTAQFIEANNLKGKAYVDYFSSSYLLWALQPEFKTYLDLRDLDIFEEQFITNNLLNYTRPTTPTKSGLPLFRFMEDIDNFSYVVMENNDKFVNFHRYMHQQPDYVLAYADPLNSVYIRDLPDNKELVSYYRQMDIDEKFHPYTRMEPSLFNKLISKVLAPWFEPLPEDYRYSEYLMAYKRRYTAQRP